ncbi:MAG TPA: transporter substrate-binding domain-containing protein [Spirochaetota bacterium]|nr:transporter substrate-binding domain-containing protein [Spirochaetota bacterium]
MQAKLLKTTIILIILNLFYLYGDEIKKITFVEDPWPPFAIGKELTEPTEGYAVELNKEIFKRLNIKVEFELLPWKRCLAMNQTGQVDGIMLLTKNKEREEFLDYSDVVIEDRDLVWYLASREQPIEWSNFEDLKEYQIGRSFGFNYGDDFNNASVKYKFIIDEAKDDETNFKKLLLSRIDLFICNETATISIIKKNEIFKGKFKYSTKPLKKVQFYIAFSKKSMARSLLPKVNKTIAQMKKENLINKIFDR